MGVFMHEGEDVLGTLSVLVKLLILKFFVSLSSKNTTTLSLPLMTTTFQIL